MHKVQSLIKFYDYAYKKFFFYTNIHIFRFTDADFQVQSLTILGKVQYHRLEAHTNLKDQL